MRLDDENFCSHGYPRGIGCGTCAKWRNVEWRDDSISPWKPALLAFAIVAAASLVAAAVIILTRGAAS